MKRIISILLLILLIVMAGCSSAQKETEKQQTTAPPLNKLAELKIASSPGPVSYALAYIQENNIFNDTADKTTVIPWSTGDQLKAMVASNQVHFAATPINNAMMLYNKGVDVKLVNVAVWGMLYVVSADVNLSSLEQLKGQEIAVAGKGGIHDLVFRHLLLTKNINPDQDLKIVYTDQAEASTKLVTRELKYAVLNEPSSSMALGNAKKNGVELTRAIDLQKEWAAMMGNSDAKIPQAGFVVVGETANNDDLINAFTEKFALGSQWVNDNSETAGPLTEKYFNKMKAASVTASLKFARLRPTAAADSQKNIEAFYNELLKTAPKESVGGKLPNAGFYYKEK